MNVAAASSIALTVRVQANMALNWPDTGRYKLSDAIAHSIRTKGCLLFERLAVRAQKRTPLHRALRTQPPGRPCCTGSRPVRSLCCDIRKRIPHSAT